MPSKANKRKAAEAKRAELQGVNAPEDTTARSSPSAAPLVETPSDEAFPALGSMHQVIQTCLPSATLLADDEFPSLGGPAPTSTPFTVEATDFPGLGGPAPSQSAPKPTWGKGIVTEAPKPAAPKTPEKCVETVVEWKDEEEMEIPTTYNRSQQLPALEKSPATTPISLITNSHPLRIVEKKVMYRTNVTISKMSEGFDNPMVLVGGDRKKQADCQKLMDLALKMGNLQNEIAGFDGAATLYSGRKLDRTIYLDSKDATLPADFRKEHFSKREGYYVVELSYNEKVGPLDPAKIMEERMEKLSLYDRSVTNMVYVVLLQQAKDAHFVLCDNGNQVYDLSEEEVEAVKNISGVVTAYGVSICIRNATGEKGTGQIQVIIDVKCSHFFKEGPLKDLEPFQRRGGLDLSKIRLWVKGLSVGTVYDQQKFELDGATKEKSGELKLGDKTLLQNCADLAKKPLNSFCREYPAMEVRHGKGKEKKTYFHAVENLKVMRGQKQLPKHGLPPKAIEPEKRFNLTRQKAQDAFLLPSEDKAVNRGLELLGLKIDLEPIRVTGLQLQPPTIHYRGGEIAIPNLSNKAAWEIKFSRNGRGGLLQPVNIPYLLLLYNSTDRESVETKMQMLSELLPEQAKKLGMNVERTVLEDLGTQFPGKTNNEAIMAKMAQLGQLRQKPIVLYGDCLENPTQGTLKLAERMYNVITAHVTAEKALKKLGSGSKNNTIDNVLLKLNVKGGGHNHNVSLGSDTSIKHLYGQESHTLIFSYDVCHSSGTKAYRAGERCTEPSTVGVIWLQLQCKSRSVYWRFPLPAHQNGASAGRHSDCENQESALEVQEHPSSSAEEDRLLRDGVAENQYYMVVNHEFPAINRGIEEVYRAERASRPNTAVVVATKRHNSRLFVKTVEGVINAPPLTVVDHTITRMNVNEMIFLSHCPVQGTAQPLLLNMLTNEGVFQSKEQLLKLIMALCCTHQHSTNIVSLPESIMAADRYAKRGSDMFTAFTHHKAGRLDGYVIVEKHTSDSRKNRKYYDHEKLTAELCYEKCDMFRNRRIV